MVVWPVPENVEITVTLFKVCICFLSDLSCFVSNIQKKKTPKKKAKKKDMFVGLSHYLHNISSTGEKDGLCPAKGCCCS